MFAAGSTNSFVSLGVSVAVNYRYVPSRTTPCSLTLLRVVCYAALSQATAIGYRSDQCLDNYSARIVDYNYKLLCFKK